MMRSEVRKSVVAKRILASRTVQLRRNPTASTEEAQRSIHTELFLTLLIGDCSCKILRVCSPVAHLIVVAHIVGFPYVIRSLQNG